MRRLRRVGFLSLIVCCASVSCLVFVSSASALPRLECAVWYRDGETHASSTYTCNEWRVVGFEGWKQDTGFYDPYPDTTPHEGPGAGRGDTGPQRGVEQKREEAKGEADAAVAQASTEAEAQPCPQAPANTGGSGNGLTGRSGGQTQVQAVLPGEGTEIVLSTHSQNAIIAINSWGAAIRHWRENGFTSSLPVMAIRMLTARRNMAFRLAREAITAAARHDPGRVGGLCRGITSANAAIAKALIDIAGAEGLRNAVHSVWNLTGVESIRETDPDGVPLANGTFLDAGMYVDQFLTEAGVVDTVIRGNTDLVMDQIDYYYRIATGHAPPP